MSVKRKIVGVDIADAKNTVVRLDDGSTLEGVTYAVATAGVNQISSVVLNVYIYPKKKGVTVRNRNTGEKHFLESEEAVDRFFDNRDPFDWIKA